MVNTRGLKPLVRYKTSLEVAVTAGGRPLGELGLVRHSPGSSSAEYLLLPGESGIEVNGATRDDLPGVGPWTEGVRLGVVTDVGLQELTWHELTEGEDPETLVVLTMRGGQWLVTLDVPFRRGSVLLLPVERGTAYAFGVRAGNDVRVIGRVVPYRNGEKVTGDDLFLEEKRPVRLGEDAVVTVIP